MKYLFVTSTLFIGILLSCSDEIGNLDFETEQQKEHAILIPEIGVFNFKQSFRTTTLPNDIITSLKVTSDNNDGSTTMIDYEIIAFKSNTWSYNNIAFIKRAKAEINKKEFDTINSDSKTFLEDNNTYISIFKDSDTISGHYTGTGKITLVNETTSEDVFNIYSTINNLNQIIIVPKKESKPLDYIIGTYIQENEKWLFSGKVYKDGKEIGVVKNTELDSQIFDKTIEDRLQFTVNDTIRQLKFTIQKTN